MSEIKIWATVLVAALMPVVFVTIGGGADLDIGSWRLSFWGWLGPLLALAGSLVIQLLANSIGRGRWSRCGMWLALLLFSWVAVRMWTGGDQAARIVHFAQGGWLMLLVVGMNSLWRHRIHPKPTWKALLGSIVAGVIIFSGVVLADRADLKKRIEIGTTDNGRSDVILIVVDALRADVLGLYGAEPSPSPFLDGLASTGMVFDRAFSQAPWTVPSVASLMSSLYPTTIRPAGKENGWKVEGGNLVRPLPEDMPWLSTRFRKAGYHTAGLVKNDWLNGPSGFDRGFDVFEYVGGTKADGHSAQELVSAVQRWSKAYVKARTQKRVDRFFLYVHFMDPHIPYRPPGKHHPERQRNYEGPLDGTAGSLLQALKDGPGPTVADREHLMALYRGEVAYLDTQLRNLHQVLTEAGLWDVNTIVVFASDHGEQFGEHGTFQHGDVYRENVHVPLVLFGPNLQTGRLEIPVRLIDVAPTLLELAGLDGFNLSEGRSLTPALLGQSLTPIPVLTEHGGKRRVTGTTHSLLLRGKKQSVFAVEDFAEVSQVSSDEAFEAPELLAWLLEHEARRIPSFSQAQPVEIDPDVLKGLQELGYLD
ncbi:MAG: hypothetical protein DRJ65_05845 [Acidobacteria bacterium]|nr:MAG: hypothetical protein DRJ65_05845 [Acidobacteriota bacterium]